MPGYADQIFPENIARSEMEQNERYVSEINMMRKRIDVLEDRLYSQNKEGFMG